jgi:hypothetical protein
MEAVLLISVNALCYKLSEESNEIWFLWTCTLAN